MKFLECHWYNILIFRDGGNFFLWGGTALNHINLEDRITVPRIASALWLLSRIAKIGFEKKMKYCHSYKSSPSQDMGDRIKSTRIRLYGSEQGPLHRCYDYVAWCPCGTPNNESGRG